MSRLSLIALVSAGIMGLAACGQDGSENGDAAEEQNGDGTPAEQEDGEGDNGEAAGDVDETITVEAGENGQDLYFDGIPETLPAGTIEIDLDNVGDMPHDLVVEELDDEVVADTESGETDTGTVELEPGEYTFYCSIGNHREQGMEETVTVE
ncbi:plastocyanin/azurin family copper-binding protein [Halostreptopolyspora alba]|uniref:EfeO-type cupredoxin-like domain-containing protein n=1 Tax=Halostreptopolyspora alba TaxID=2487137 RepID=A0A3N0ED90_9ACTN|nr:hypothetical protein EFW17_07645 [Nocardiopsaceae bacterium YIM 96095]